MTNLVALLSFGGIAELRPDGGHPLQAGLITCEHNVDPTAFAPECVGSNCAGFTSAMKTAYRETLVSELQRRRCDLLKSRKPVVTGKVEDLAHFRVSAYS
jgi:hypothetical protein